MAQKKVKKAVVRKSTTFLRKPSAKRRTTGVKVGSVKKSNKIIGALFDGTRKWVTLAAVLLVFGGIGVYFLKSSSAAVLNDYGCTTTPFLAYGYDGNCTKKLQNVLNYKGGYGIVVDGIFRSATDSAVRKYQSSKGLGVDGKVGSQTWGSLNYGISYSSSTTTTTTNTISSNRDTKINTMTSKALLWSYPTMKYTTTLHYAYTSKSDPTSCARFVSELIRQSNADTDMVSTAAVWDIKNYLLSSKGSSKWSVTPFSTGVRPSLQKGDVLLVIYSGSTKGHALYYNGPGSGLTSGYTAFEAAINSRAPGQITDSTVNWLVNKSGTHYRARLR